MAITATAKLVIGAFVVAGTTVYMAYLGAASSWQYYLTAEECAAQATELAGQRLRVSGSIAPGSLKVAANRSQATFAFETDQGTIHVVCSRPLPDRLAEGIEVVVEGRMEEGGLLRGERLLTRCASKYIAEPADAADHDAACPKATQP